MGSMKRINLRTLAIVCFVLVFVALLAQSAQCHATGGEWIGHRNEMGRWVMACVR